MKTIRSLDLFSDELQRQRVEMRRRRQISVRWSASVILLLLSCLPLARSGMKMVGRVRSWALGGKEGGADLLGIILVFSQLLLLHDNDDDNTFGGCVALGCVAMRNPSRAVAMR